jgi:hypothetical protein
MACVGVLHFVSFDFWSVHSLAFKILSRTRTHISKRKENRKKKRESNPTGWCGKESKKQRNK